MTRVGKFSGRDNTAFSGLAVSQCPLCFELFSGEATFVLHRIDGASTSGRPGEHLLGKCRDPKTKGLRLNPYGVWGTGISRLSGAPDCASRGIAGVGA
jgi:hypothetical protein